VSSLTIYSVNLRSLSLSIIEYILSISIYYLRLICKLIILKILIYKLSLRILKINK